MKTVHTPEMVAHLFANSVQDNARTSSHNFYFSGDQLFSYGSHFCLAKHVENKKKERTLLFTTRSYSITTAKHIRVTERASNHLNKIYCPYPNKDHGSNLGTYLQNIKLELTGLARAKKPEKYIIPAQQIAKHCREYCDFFGIKFPKEITKLLEAASSGEYATYLVKEAKIIEREKIKNEKARAIKRDQALVEWRAFELQRFDYWGERDYLRIDTKKKRIQTSQNVQIPFEIAKKAYTWLKKTIKSGGCSGECSYSILDFKVKSVTPELFTIGCHKFDMSEIEAVAKTLNWK